MTNKKVIVIVLLLLVIFIFGCTKIQPPKEEKPSYKIPYCGYYQEVGSYSGNATEVALDIAFNILNKRDPRITKEYLELNTMPYVSYATNPPSRSNGTIRYPILDRKAPDQVGKLMLVESSEVIQVTISTDFYNKYFSKISVKDTTCTIGQSQSEDSTCIGLLSFYRGQVLIGFTSPC